VDAKKLKEGARERQVVNVDDLDPRDIKVLQVAISIAEAEGRVISRDDMWTVLKEANKQQSEKTVQGAEAITPRGELEVSLFEILNNAEAPTT